MVATGRTAFVGIMTVGRLSSTTEENVSVKLAKVERFPDVDFRPRPAAFHGTASDLAGPRLGRSMRGGCQPPPW